MLEGVVDIASGHAERGEKACEDAGNDGESKSKGEHGGVELDFAELRQLGGEEFEEKLNAKVSRDEAEGSSDERDEDGFSEELLHDARAARAHGGADGDLFAARKGACEKEIGDVGTGDEKDEGDGGEHHEERGTDIADGLVAERMKDCAPAFVIGGVGLFEPLGDGVHLGLCLLRG